MERKQWKKASSDSRRGSQYKNTPSSSTNNFRFRKNEKVAAKRHPDHLNLPLRISTKRKMSSPKRSHPDGNSGRPSKVQKLEETGMVVNCFCIVVECSTNDGSAFTGLEEFGVLDGTEKVLPTKVTVKFVESYRRREPKEATKRELVSVLVLFNSLPLLFFQFAASHSSLSLLGLETSLLRL